MLNDPDRSGCGLDLASMGVCDDRSGGRTGQAASAGPRGPVEARCWHLRIIVVDRSAILVPSKVGKDIVRQL